MVGPNSIPPHACRWLGSGHDRSYGQRPGKFAETAVCQHTRLTELAAAYLARYGPCHLYSHVRCATIDRRLAGGSSPPSFNDRHLSREDGYPRCWALLCSSFSQEPASRKRRSQHASSLCALAIPFAGTIQERPSERYGSVAWGALESPGINDGKTASIIGCWGKQLCGCDDPESHSGADFLYVVHSLSFSSWWRQVLAGVSLATGGSFASQRAWRPQFLSLASRRSAVRRLLPGFMLLVINFELVRGKCSPPSWLIVSLVTLPRLSLISKVTPPEAIADYEVP